MKNKFKKYGEQKLQDGLYMVSVRFLEDPSEDDIFQRFTPYDCEEIVYNSAIRKSGIIVKYRRGLDYVTEYKTGVKIPLYFAKPNKKVKINDYDDKKDDFYYCVILSYYNKLFKTGKDLKSVHYEKFEDDSSAYITKNLLELPKKDLDDIMETYNGLNIMENVLKELDKVKENYKIESNNVNEEQFSFQDNKNRNYEKYFYVDEVPTKSKIKKLFGKK